MEKIMQKDRDNLLWLKHKWEEREKSEAAKAGNDNVPAFSDLQKSLLLLAENH